MFKPMKCPIKPYDNNGTIYFNNQMFDEESSQCVNKSRVGIFGKCQSYKECIIVSSLSHVEKWVELECEANFHFDKNTNICVDSSLSNCSKYF